MQSSKEWPHCQATNIAKTMRETDFSAGVGRGDTTIWNAANSNEEGLFLDGHSITEG